MSSTSSPAASTDAIVTDADDAKTSSRSQLSELKNNSARIMGYIPKLIAGEKIADPDIKAFFATMQYVALV